MWQQSEAWLSLLRRATGTATGDLSTLDHYRVGVTAVITVMLLCHAHALNHIPASGDTILTPILQVGKLRHGPLSNFSGTEGSVNGAEAGFESRPLGPEQTPNYYSKLSSPSRGP